MACFDNSPSREHAWDSLPPYDPESEKPETGVKHHCHYCEFIIYHDENLIVLPTTVNAGKLNERDIYLCLNCGKEMNKKLGQADKENAL